MELKEAIIEIENRAKDAEDSAKEMALNYVTRNNEEARQSSLRYSAVRAELVTILAMLKHENSVGKFNK